MMSDFMRIGSVGKGGVGSVVKQVKVERPRPLKIGGGAHPELSQEDLLFVIDSIRKNLGSKCEGVGADQMVGQLQLLCANLKLIGPNLEQNNKDQMDKLNQALMNACRLDSLDLVARVHMLEIIELRTMGWQANENVTNYYKQKLAQIESESNPNTAVCKAQTAPVTLNPSAPNFNPFMKSFESKPSTNSKSDVLELKNSTLKGLNEKPGKESSSVGVVQSNVPEETQIKSENFECTVKAGNEEIKISGASEELVKTAKIVLHEFFNICPPDDTAMESPPPEDEENVAGARKMNSSGGSSKSVESDSSCVVLVKPEISYEKQELMALSKSPLCKMTPVSWSEVTKDLPGVMRRADRAGPTSKIIQREMEGLRKQEEAKNV